MKLDQFFDIREALKDSDPTVLIDNAHSYVTRLLDVLDAISDECAVSEAHAAQWSDTPSIYTETVRDMMRFHGSP
jgi:hypothetical protein